MSANPNPTPRRQYFEAPNPACHIARNIRELEAERDWLSLAYRLEKDRSLRAFERTVMERLACQIAELYTHPLAPIRRRF